MENKYMKIALEEAKKAYDQGEIPVGAVIVKDDIVIAKAYNIKELSQNPLKHAELIVIEKASKNFNNWRLVDCDIYVTLEPCPMCASALKQARVKNVYYGTSHSDETMHEVVEKIFLETDINSPIVYKKGVMEKECTELLQKFFKTRRKNNI